MGTAERRNQIMKILCRRRHETISNLALEFGVSERTIRRDIEILSLSEPIYTQTGRYGGGVYIVEGYSIGQLYVSDTESSVLHKLYELAKNRKKCVITDEELNLLKYIVETYTKPSIEKGKNYEKQRKIII